MKITCLRCGHERRSLETCMNQLCHGPQPIYRDPPPPAQPKGTAVCADIDCSVEYPTGKPKESAGREWWIDPSDELDKDDDCEIEETVYMALREHPRQGPLLWQSNLVHVIEHSAYLAVVAERDQWKSEHDNLSKFAEDLRQKYQALLPPSSD